MSKKSKNKPFDGVSLTRWDSLYPYPKVELIVNGKDLKIRFTNTISFKGWECLKKYKYADFYITDFKRLTARKLLDRIVEFSVNKYRLEPDGWRTRHLEDGVHELYKALGLDLGYTVKFLKGLF